MSTQRGNHKKGSQKHQNTTAFKNNLHDTSKRTKEINEIDLEGLCERCKEIIEWKIKYKKYKILTVPKKCTKCEQKAIKKAYYIVCLPCIARLNVCGKCGQKKDLISQPGLLSSEQMSLDSQFQQELEMLPERKRRTFFRLQAKGELTGEEIETKLKEEITKTGVMDDNFLDELSDSDDNDTEDDTIDTDIVQKVSEVNLKTVAAS